MKTFKFGQLLSKEDICNRQEEIRLLNEVCKTGGRAVVYGPRRFGKTSVVKNVILKDFLDKNEKSLAVYADLFQLDSMEDMALRLQIGVEQALSRRAGIKTFLNSIQNYLKHFRVEITVDPLSGAPTIAIAGQHMKDEKSLSEMLLAIKDFSKEYKTLLVLDEFQDVKRIQSLEAKLRSEIQSLDLTAVILLGSKKHISREIFHDESKPFYGFGIDVEFKEIARADWLPYMEERFTPCDLTIKQEGVIEICNLMRDVPNSIQELCQWITLSGQTGLLTLFHIHKNLTNLIENKSSRYIEKLASLSVKEKRVLIAAAKQEPVSSITSTKFLQETRVSATATKATILRITDQGILDYTENGYFITDPIFRLFLVRRFG